MTVQEDVNNLGRNIRKLRLNQNRTLEEIAKQCGFTRSLLSKIETGKAIPPIATLVKISNALGTKMSALIESTESDGTVYTSQDEVLKNIVKTEQGYHIFPFATEHQNKKMQPFIFVMRKGEVKAHSFSHKGEEFFYIIKGEAKCQVGSVIYTLKEGDSIYFDATNEHSVEPVSDEIIYLDIFV